MWPFSIPKASSTILSTGIMALVVQEEFEKMGSFL
jgi:hypothetical protein